MRIRGWAVVIAGVATLAAPQSPSAQTLNSSVLGNGGARIGGGGSHVVVGTVGQALVGPRSGWWCVEPGQLVDAPELGRPERLAFDLPRPNPFSREVLVSFALPRQARVEVNIMDVTGRRIRRLVNQQFDAGTYTVRWNGEGPAGRSVGPGVYFMDFRVDGHRESRRRVVVVR